MKAPYIEFIPAQPVCFDHAQACRLLGERYEQLIQRGDPCCFQFITDPEALPGQHEYLLNSHFSAPLSPAWTQSSSGKRLWLQSGGEAYLNFVSSSPPLISEIMSQAITLPLSLRYYRIRFTVTGISPATGALLHVHALNSSGAIIRTLMTVSNDDSYVIFVEKGTEQAIGFELDASALISGVAAHIALSQTSLISVDNVFEVAIKDASGNLIHSLGRAHEVMYHEGKYHTLVRFGWSDFVIPDGRCHIYVNRSVLGTFTLSDADFHQPALASPWTFSTSGGSLTPNYTDPLTHLNGVLIEANGTGNDMILMQSVAMQAGIRYRISGMIAARNSSSPSFALQIRAGSVSGTGQFAAEGVFSEDIRCETSGDLQLLIHAAPSDNHAQMLLYNIQILWLDDDEQSSLPYQLADVHPCTHILSWRSHAPAFGFVYPPISAPDDYRHYLRTRCEKLHLHYIGTKIYTTLPSGAKVITTAEKYLRYDLSIDEQPQTIHRALGLMIDHDSVMLDDESFFTPDPSYEPFYRQSSSLAPSAITLEV